MSTNPEETKVPLSANDAVATKGKQVETAPPTEPTEGKEVDASPQGKVEDANASTDKTNDLSPSAEKAEETTAIVAASPTPATTGPNADSSSPSEPTWPETPADHPLTKFYEVFEDLTKEAGHNEVYGVTLSKSQPFHTKLILQKFLRANSNDLTKAKEQLLDTLRWRKEYNPAEAAKATYEKDRFDGLGYIMTFENVPESANKKDVVTFNIYGAVKDNKKTFGDLEAFLKWRVGLMERSVQKLDLPNATKPIPNFGEGHDPYQGYQVHDYLQVSFLRQDPLVKAAVKKTVDTLGRYYPETLSRKFFVNVPMIMGWLYTATKLLVAKETMKKFVVLSYGNQLAAELGPGAPKEYGGNAAELKELGEAMNLEG